MRHYAFLFIILLCASISLSAEEREVWIAFGTLESNSPLDTVQTDPSLRNSVMEKLVSSKTPVYIRTESGQKITPLWIPTEKDSEHFGWVFRASIPKNEKVFWLVRDFKRLDSVRIRPEEDGPLFLVSYNGEHFPFDFKAFQREELFDNTIGYDPRKFGIQPFSPLNMGSSSMHVHQRWDGISKIIVETEMQSSFVPRLHTPQNPALGGEKEVHDYADHNNKNSRFRFEVEIRFAQLAFLEFQGYYTPLILVPGRTLNLKTTEKAALQGNGKSKQIIGVQLVEELDENGFAISLNLATNGFLESALFGPISQEDYVRWKDALNDYEFDFPLPPSDPNHVLDLNFAWYQSIDQAFEIKEGSRQTNFVEYWMDHYGSRNSFQNFPVGRERTRSLNGTWFLHSPGYSLLRHAFFKKGAEKSYLAKKKKNQWKNGLIWISIILLLGSAFGLTIMIIRPGKWIKKLLTGFEVGLNLILLTVLFGALIMGVELSVPGFEGYEFYSGIFKTTTIQGLAVIFPCLILFYINAFYAVPIFLARRNLRTYARVTGVLFGSLIILPIILLPFFVPYLGDLLFALEKGFFHSEPLVPGRIFRLADFKWSFLFEILLGGFTFFLPFWGLSTFYGTVRHFFTQHLIRLETKNTSLVAELNSLKAQINPHFLFNSLNTAHTLSLQEDSPRTTEAISTISNLLRFSIYEGNRPYVKLIDEVSYLEDYLDLQELRLDKEIHSISKDIKIETEEELYIAPMILIPFLENAFKHGISNESPTYIHFYLHVVDGHLIMRIGNSINKLRKKTKGGLGVSNTRKRLELLYPNKHSLVVDSSDKDYFVELRLDLVLTEQDKKDIL